MKDLDALLKTIADGLAAMADGIHAMVKKVDNLAKGQAPKKPAKAKPATKKKVATHSKKSANKVKPQGIKHMPATDKVLEAIKRSGDGMNNATISKETGLNQKQVSSALMRLKKYGKIKSVKRGIHTVA
jgi:predicted Rossmann fold nucleotide-binding protein DprA/Smf involved in DNA uptake